MQQNATPEILKARIWADGWKSDAEIRRESKYFGDIYIESDTARQIIGAPQSSLIATKKLVGCGIALLVLGSGLITYYFVTLKGAAG